MIQAVLDVETLGLPKKGETPEVLAIGVMLFDDMSAQFKKYFYRVLKPNGGCYDKSTKLWWLTQRTIVKQVAGIPIKPDEPISFELPKDIKSEKYDISFQKVDATNALKDLVDFCTSNNVKRFWANSPTFDCRILEELCEANKVLSPWYNNGKNEFWRQRDIRTIKDIFDQFDLTKETYVFLKLALDDFREMGISKLWYLKHFALYDCVAEASMVCTTQEFLYKCQVVIEG